MTSHREWNEMFETVESLGSLGKAVRSKWWDVIERRYGEPQRFYHTLKHIDTLLSLSSPFRPSLTHPDIFLLSIFFHDVVYDPKAKDNEEQSAELFKEFALEAGINQEDAETVFKWILFTKTHAIPEEYERESTASLVADLKLFLDLDLSIFVVSPEDYDEYCKEIRGEYIHYSEPDFFRGRAAVMTHFLERSPIYKTPHFQSLEHIARANISREIKQLQDKIQALS
eukprot:TRINITY_DN4918_c0_g1_i1.p1 TRINITY_DN4918_c0_g1~~TRINITY_DN4918_c0_g1_i1.p1  ORF type:complete len:227 (+),score=71.08 TRINITY_DN4918_c0_g1_i1:72-752(+)